MKELLRKLPLFFILFILVLPARGQQQLFFSQYIFDAMVFNPAYAGSQEALSLTAQYRMQWTGLQGAPDFQSLSAHSPVISQNVGLGLRISNDQMGGYGQQTLSPVFAYRIRLAPGRFISAGLQSNLTRQKNLPKDIHLRDPDDPVFSEQPAAFSLSFGTGLFYGAKNFYAGIAVPDLFPDVMEQFEETAYRQGTRTFIGHAGLVVNLHPEVKWKPNLLVAVPGSGSMYADVNMLFLLRDVLWMGASYRLNQGMAALTQVQLNPQLAIGYSYDLPLQGGSYLNSPSHEISVQYRFYFVETAVKSPRYF